jgi:TonB family protein
MRGMKVGIWLVGAVVLGASVARADEVDAGASAAQALVQPVLLQPVDAAYPAEAQAQALEGDVVMDLDLDGEGRVTAVRVRPGTGLGLGAAAAAAARQFVFSPARLGDRPRAVTVEYTTRFRLMQPLGGAAQAPDAGEREEEHHLVHLGSVIDAPAPTSAASAETVRDRDLVLRPHATPEDILRVVPGLVIAQHQGGGKADQLFLRGFDADHGTDVALFVDGAPVNLPSHGHGQGFADLHFLIPETIDRVDVTKGPYFAEYGDFDTAGAVNLRTRHAFDESSVSATYGSFSTYRLLGIASPSMADGLPWVAAEVYGTQGPFAAGEGLERYNVFAKETLQLNQTTTLSLLGSVYGSQWRSSGQLPERAVDAQRLDRFGAIDPTEGGQTQRQELVLTLDHKRGDDAFKVSAFAIRYGVRLFSDFTFQARDPVHFDEIEQNDDRTVTGLSVRYTRTTRLLGMRLQSSLGADARYDDIVASLWHDQARQRLAQCFDVALGPCDHVHTLETHIGAYVEEDLRVNAYLRVIGAVRADLFEFHVDDLKDRASYLVDPGVTSGLAQASIVNPKLRVVLKPASDWDVYLDGGGGFHSNDARSVVATQGKGAVPRAWGAEVGTRVKLLDRLDLAAAGWFLYLQSEQTFVADDDTTEASDPTRRFGVDLEARCALFDWLWADADLSLAHATYTQDHGNGSAVALAPTRTGSAGLTALHPSGLKGRLGVRYVGDRPATADGSITAKGYTLVDLSLGYRWRFVEVGLVVENLLDTEWSEAQFASASRLAFAPYNEAAPVTDLHFTPGSPVNGRLTLSLFF